MLFPLAECLCSRFCRITKSDYTVSDAAFGTPMDAKIIIQNGEKSGAMEILIAIVPNETYSNF
jgi:hypothetical protein